MQRAKEYFWGCSSCCTSPLVTSDRETKVITNLENKTCFDSLDFLVQLFWARSRNNPLNTMSTS